MIEHPFAPVWDASCRVLILGSFPSVASREQGFYYGHPRNRFWTMLARIYGEDCPAEPAQKKEFLLHHHIALWDAAARCDAEGSLDSGIRRAEPTDLSAIAAGSGISLVLANGQLAGKIYRRYQQPLIHLPVHVLPSTSPANAAWSLDRLCAAWIKYLPENHIEYKNALDN